MCDATGEFAQRFHFLCVTQCFFDGRWNLFDGDMHSMYDDDGDLAHYFRFQQLKYGRAYLPADDAGVPSGPPVSVDYEASYPMLANPRSADYADPELLDFDRREEGRGRHRLHS